jgi:UPF0755 protein
VSEKTDGSERAAVLERRRRRRRRVLVPLAFLSPLILLAAGVYAWWHVQLDPPGHPGAAITLTIPKGAGVRDIGRVLSKKKVIDSSFAFDAYVRLGHSGPFDAGDYRLQRNLGIQAAVHVLERGPIITYVTLRIPPGLWLAEVAKQVQKQMPGLSAAKFVALAQSDAVRSKYEPAGVHTLEGLLFPDTYRFTTKDREIDVLRTMVKRFDSVATTDGLDRVHVPGLTPYQVIVAASIVQEESGTDHDRPLIASVIDNRLKANMLLQMDATVVYALQVRKGANTPADRANPSPYNTYVHEGLPPTPIGATAEKSLLAALHPASTTYLYFVVAGTDGHSAFATTLAEHNANVEASRRLGLLQ